MSKFPAVRRDLSIIVDEAVEMAAVKSVVEQVGPDVLKNFGLFDVYRGEGIDSGRKSFAIGLTFQANSRTLNDDEIDAAVSAVVDGLRARVGAVLRLKCPLQKPKWRKGCTRSLVSTSVRLRNL